MKKKVLIFHPTIAPYRVDLFNSFSEEFDIKVCLFNPYDSTFDNKLLYSKLIFNPMFMDISFKIGNSFFSRDYWKQVDLFCPDIVIVSEYGIGSVLVLLHRWIEGRKYKVVTICDDSYNMLVEDNDFSITHKLARKIITPLMDEIIVVEPKTRDWYQKRYGKGYWFPIIRDDDKQRDVYEKVLPQSQRLMEKHGLEGKNVFIYVGRFVALKNVPRIIEAFSKLNQEMNVLVLVGSGEEEANIKDAAAKHHVRPIFTGRLEGEELYAWYNVADYFVLASWQESFGAVANEALLAGCYSLISKRAGSRCLIEEGINGYTFDPMDVEELSSKMNSITERFPKSRPLDRVKRNLMSMSYNDAVEKLINHIDRL